MKTIFVPCPTRVRIVFTSSGVGRTGRALWGAYAVSKFGTEGLAQVLADEEDHIRVNAVNPGRTRTAMYTDSIEQLRGAAGPRQVTVRAETALAAFTTPSSGGWIMFGKYPS